MLDTKLGRERREGLGRERREGLGGERREGLGRERREGLGEKRRTAIRLHCSPRHVQNALQQAKK